MSKTLKPDELLGVPCPNDGWEIQWCTCSCVHQHWVPMCGTKMVATQL